MRIVHVIPYFLPARAFGGPLIALYEIAKAQIRLGHEVTIFTTNAVRHGVFPSLPIRERIDGILVRRFRVRAEFMSYFFTLGLLKDLMKADFDVIHAHGIRNFQTDAAAISLRVKKKPLVISLHGMFSKNTAAERGSKKGQMIYNTYDFLTGDFSLKTAKILIANSKYEYRNLPRYKRKTRIVPHGVNTEIYRPQNRKDSDEKVILYAGRLSRGKNIAVLLRTCKELKKDFNLRLVIVGEEVPSVQGGKSYKKEILKLSKKLDLESNVIFRGHLNEEELITAYNQTDIFVNPSSAENFCMALLEACACGTPVVSTKVGIAPELLKEHSWLLFDDEKELREILEKLLENEVLRKNTGAQLRKKVAEEYTWEIAAKRLEAVYEEALAIK